MTTRPRPMTSPKPMTRAWIPKTLSPSPKVAAAAILPRARKRPRTTRSRRARSYTKRQLCTLSLFFYFEIPMY